MIRINKEMLWKDVMQRYHDRDIFGTVLEHEKIGKMYVPKTIFLKAVVEDRDDLEEIDRRILYDGEDGEKLAVPMGYTEDKKIPYYQNIELGGFSD